MGIYTALLFQRTDFAKIKKKMTLYKSIFLLWIFDWILIIMRKCHGMSHFILWELALRPWRKCLPRISINKNTKHFTPSHNSECFFSFTIPPTSFLFSSLSLSFPPASSPHLLQGSLHASQAPFLPSAHLNLLFLMYPFLSLSLPRQDILTVSFFSPLSLYSLYQFFPLQQNPCCGLVNCWLPRIMYCVSLSCLSFLLVVCFFRMSS